MIDRSFDRSLLAGSPSLPNQGDTDMKRSTSGTRKSKRRRAIIARPTKQRTPRRTAGVYTRSPHGRSLNSHTDTARWIIINSDRRRPEQNSGEGGGGRNGEKVGKIASGGEEAAAVFLHESMCSRRQGRATAGQGRQGRKAARELRGREESEQYSTSAANGGTIEPRWGPAMCLRRA